MPTSVTRYQIAVVCSTAETVTDEEQRLRSKAATIASAMRWLRDRLLEDLPDGSLCSLVLSDGGSSSAESDETPGEEMHEAP